jgi:serpin B
MVLANALYFNAPWLNPFEKNLTTKASFNGSLRKSEINMMSRRGYMNYAEYQGCQLVELPYEGGRYSMFVLLPAAEMDINDAVSYLNEDLYNAAMKALSSREVLLKMPKTKLETSLLLNQTLGSMGIKSAFTSAANFKGIAEMGPLVLDQVKQKCYVDISESGTEAAAVTVAQIRLTSVRPSSFVTMTVDRPYLFFIVDKQNSNVMFAGRVMNL